MWKQDKLNSENEPEPINQAWFQSHLHKIRSKRHF